MHASLLPARTCLWCYTPFEGRADKKFCKSACKASYSRTMLAADAPGPAPVATRPLPASRPQPATLVDWQARCEQAEQILHAQEQVAQAALPFDQEYDRLEQVVMQYYSPDCSISVLSYLLLQVEKGLAQYTQHPALSNPQHAARYRLNSLYMVQRFLQTEHRHLLNREKHV
jgi:hypothetical protein